MAVLHIGQKPSKLSLRIPHKLFINRRFIGILPKEDVRLELPAGEYLIGIQSMLPFFSSEIVCKVTDEVTNHLIFKDREKWWDILFVIDIICWIADFFFQLPTDPINWDLIYEIFTNGYFILWLIYEWMIRKKYFKMDFFQTK